MGEDIAAVAITQADYEALAAAVACDDKHSIRAQAISSGRNATRIVAYEALRALATQRVKYEAEIAELKEHREHWMTKCQGTRSLELAANDRAAAAEALLAETRAMVSHCIETMREAGMNGTSGYAAAFLERTAWHG